MSALQMFLALFRNDLVLLRIAARDLALDARLHPRLMDTVDLANEVAERIRDTEAAISALSD